MVSIPNSGASISRASMAVMSPAGRYFPASGAKANKIGRAVKAADIKDNLDISRINDITESDINRLNRYKKALISLKGQRVKD